MHTVHEARAWARKSVSQVGSPRLRQAEPERPATATDIGDQSQLGAPRQATGRPSTAAATLSAEEAASDSGSGRSSANAFRSRLSRGGVGRGATPPHGSTSSFGGAGSVDRSGGDSGSVSGSWGRGGRRRGSRPETQQKRMTFCLSQWRRATSKPGRANERDGMCHPALLNCNKHWSSTSSVQRSQPSIRHSDFVSILIPKA